jgi:hypothetical protein
VEMMMTDSEGGSDLDLPPHGRSTAQSRRMAPAIIVGFAQRWKDLDFQVSYVQLGQGLHEMKDDLEAKLVRVVPTCMVSTSYSTSASDYAAEEALDNLFM